MVQSAWFVFLTGPFSNVHLDHQCGNVPAGCAAAVFAALHCRVYRIACAGPARHVEEGGTCAARQDAAGADGASGAGCHRTTAGTAATARSGYSTATTATAAQGGKRGAPSRARKALDGAESESAEDGSGGAGAAFTSGAAPGCGDTPCGAPARTAGVSACNYACTRGCSTPAER